MMRGLEFLGNRFATERPFQGHEVLLHMHLTSETAKLGEILTVGGGEVFYLDSGRTAVPPNVASCIEAFGGRILKSPSKLNQLAATDGPPILVVEGNGRIFSAVHSRERSSGWLTRVRGISEHTSGGGRKIDEFEQTGARACVPVVAVYRSRLKTQLETGLGTAQSTAAALLRALGVPLAGRRICVIGFGNVGQGLAHLLRTLGARLLIVEIRSEAKLQAALAGYELATVPTALAASEIAVTTTGQSSIVTASALDGAREDIVLGNVSNCPDEIDMTGCTSAGMDGPGIEIFFTPSGRRVMLLGDGVQINHVFERGNPAEVMDLSFSLHALVLEWLVRETPVDGIYDAPRQLREQAAAACLEIGP
jgi:adenosylhomocysteinase